MIMFIVVHKIGTGVKYDVYKEAFKTLEDAMAYCNKTANEMLQDGDTIVQIKQNLGTSGYSIVNNLKMKHKFIVHRIIGDKS